MMCSYARRRMSERIRGAVEAHLCWTAAAAATAVSASSTPPSATWARICREAGFSTGIVRPDAASRHCPAMNSPVGTRAITSRRPRPAMAMLMVLLLRSALQRPVEGAGEGGDCGVDLSAVDDQRRDEPHHVVRGAAGQQQQSLVDHVLLYCDGQRRV